MNDTNNFKAGDWVYIARPYNIRYIGLIAQVTDVTSMDHFTITLIHKKFGDDNSANKIRFKPESLDLLSDSDCALYALGDQQ